MPRIKFPGGGGGRALVPTQQNRRTMYSSWGLTVYGVEHLEGEEQEDFLAQIHDARGGAA